MRDAVQPERIVRFGTFELDLDSEELRRNGLKLKLSGQPLQVLAILLERPGRVVTRDELHRRLWPDRFVDVDHNLNTAINKIREVLGDSAENPHFVETLPRRGYRFIGPGFGLQMDRALPADGAAEMPIDQAPSTEPKESPVEASRPRTSRLLFWVSVGFLACTVAALLIVAVEYLRRPLPPPRLTDYVRLTFNGRQKFPLTADANRIYYLSFDRPFGNWAVSHSGEVTRMLLEVPNLDTCKECAAIEDASPDGTRILVWGSGDRSGTELWNMDSSGRSGHYLTKAKGSGALFYPHPATWSPDGKQVLYANGHGELFVIPSGGGEPKLILSSPAGPGEEIPTWSLSWSPDGTRIRFVRFDKYWEISSTGTNLHRLLPDWDDSTLACCGRWTPDGDYFFFLAGNMPENWFNRGPVGQIWAIDERRDWIRPANPRPTRLTQGPNLWSPPVVARDGKRIFSNQTTLLGELVRYGTNSKQYQTFLSGVSAEDVAFSRDGKFVAYVTFPDGILWRARMDGEERMQLTNPPFSPKGIGWSPDGTKIAFEDEHQTGEYAIYTVSAQGGNPVRLVPEDPGPQMDPTWSPDGTQVAYCTDARFSRKPNRPRRYETHLLNLISHTAVVLPPLKDDFYSPRWSPDGRFIVGMTTSPNGLILFDLQTKQYRPLLLLPPGKGLGWNTWSRDGRYVYFILLSDGPDKVQRIPVTGSQPETVVELTGFQPTGFWWGTWFGLDPQDAPILIRDKGTQDIYALTLERK